MSSVIVIVRPNHHIERHMATYVITARGTQHAIQTVRTYPGVTKDSRIIAVREPYSGKGDLYGTAHREHEWTYRVTVTKV